MNKDWLVTMSDGIIVCYQPLAHTTLLTMLLGSLDFALCGKKTIFINLIILKFKTGFESCTKSVMMWN